jgi:hypothetical protein
MPSPLARTTCLQLGGLQLDFGLKASIGSNQFIGSGVAMIAPFLRYARLIPAQFPFNSCAMPV